MVEMLSRLSALHMTTRLQMRHTELWEADTDWVDGDFIRIGFLPLHRKSQSRVKGTSTTGIESSMTTRLRRVNLPSSGGKWTTERLSFGTIPLSLIWVSAFGFRGLTTNSQIPRRILKYLWCLRHSLEWA